MTLSLIPNNHVTNSMNSLDLFTQYLVHKIQVDLVGKHGYFTSKTGSSHTSQDNNIFINDLFSSADGSQQEL